MNEWNSNDPQLAHINLPKSKKVVNFFMWDLYIYPYLKADDKIVLDYGCGGGLFYDWLTRISTPKKYLGVDISKRSIDECKRVVHELDHDVKTRFFKLPTLPETVPQIIVCTAVIQHMTLDQFAKFHEYVDGSGAEELFIQIRYSDHTRYDPTQLIRRLSLSNLTFRNFEIEHESEVIPTNRYKYLHFKRVED